MACVANYLNIIYIYIYSLLGYIKKLIHGFEFFGSVNSDNEINILLKKKKKMKNERCNLVGEIPNKEHILSSSPLIGCNYIDFIKSKWVLVQRRLQLLTLKETRST